MTLYEQISIAVENTANEIKLAYSETTYATLLEFICELRENFKWFCLHPRTVEKDIWGPLRNNHLVILNMVINSTTVFKSNFENYDNFILKLVDSFNFYNNPTPIKDTITFNIVDDEINSKKASKEDVSNIFFNNPWLVMIYCFTLMPRSFDTVFLAGKK